MLDTLPNVPLSLIEGEGFVLRPFVPEDAESLARALNNPVVTERLTNIPYPYDYWMALRWIHSTSVVALADAKNVNFAIIIDGQVAGSVSFINMDRQQQNAQISVWIAEEYWGQGLATKALQLLLRFGFEELDLHRLFAFYVADNEKSDGMLGKLGFEKEGVHREEWKKWVDGRWQRFDSVHCSLLKPDWEERDR